MTRDAGRAEARAAATPGPAVRNGRARIWRTRTLFALLLIAGAVLGLRLVELQVFKHERFAARVADQSEDLAEIPGPRGDVTDRHGRLLAVSVPTKVLIVEPYQIEVDGLAAIERASGRPRGSLTKHARDLWRIVTRNCGPECESQIDALVASGRVPRHAVSTELGFQRRYPNGARAAHLLGFVSSDGSVSEGIERTLDHLLASSATRLVIAKDVAGRTVSKKIIDELDHGPSSLMLTIDLRIQSLLEEQLDSAVRRHGALGGSGIVIDPRNGDVLAMAALPAFDPARYGKARPERHRNPVVEVAFEPGSTLKPLIAGALLDAGAISGGELINCENGRWRFGSRRIHDHHPHSLLTLPQILEVSSNIGMAKLSQRLSSEGLHEALNRLGAGRKTGIELPGESAGVLRPVDAWTFGDHESIGFGHAVSVTLLQLAAAYGAIANDGVWVAPRVARAWGSPDGQWHALPPSRSRRALEASSARRVAGWLTRVIEGERGTGRPAAVPGYTVAGKTGTAEKVLGGRYDRTLNVATFAGFGPLPHPAAVTVIAIDQPQHNGRTASLTAAPVFSSVMAETLRLQRAGQPVLPGPGRDESRRLAQLGAQQGTR